jgi:hypothetical protein
VGEIAPVFSEKELCQWRLIERFRECLASVGPDGAARAESWKDPRRKLKHDNYLCLFLFALVNPALRTLRALCTASDWARVQREVCGEPVSLGSFSEAQGLIEPAFLERVFAELASEVHGPLPRSPHEAWQSWFAQDSSLFAALPRMTWALYGAGKAGAPNRAVRLHLSLHLEDDKPASARVTAGRVCERKAWRGQWEKGAAYVGDRYYSEDHRIFGELEAKGCRYVLRLREESSIQVEEELPVSAAEAAAGVVRQAWARLGSSARTRSVRLRVIWIRRADGGELRLATNLAPQAATADVLALLYRRRWQIECFFRWLKCLLDCRHWLAESQRGVTVQLYLALIAALLCQQHLGHRPSKRLMEAIQMYQFGWVTLQELMAAVAADKARRAARQKKG